MLDLFQQVLLLLTSLVTQEVKAIDCRPGWFGERCMYKCMCADASHCGTNGSCPNEKCTHKFFGPSCQFRNVIAMDNAFLTAAYLIDENETTCNPDPSATSVEVILHKSWPFVWFRVYVKDPTNIINFTTTFDGNKPCREENKFAADYFVDITCDIDYFIKKIHIEGPIAPEVCSIYISSGRNVALMQYATQSSTPDTQRLLSLASNAVDGNRHNKYRNGSCSATSPELKPKWYLAYNRPQILLLVVIFNRDDYRERLIGFSVEGFTQNSTESFSYEDTSSMALLFYTKSLASKIPTSKIIVNGAETDINNEQILTLCEFETYGETVCPEGTYGLWCEQKCQCTDNTICNPVTGLCTDKPCQSGFYRYNCLSQCSPLCAGSLCARRTGKCVSCVPGYQGDHCDKACGAGFYGAKCNLTCSTNCSDTCDPISGNCPCQGNYAWPTCTACRDGFYGPECNNTCSKYCLNMCDHVTGNCSCMDNYGGPTCTACRDGVYGPECENTCSKNCSNVCDHVTGNCSCMDNYGGPTCTDCGDGFYGPECKSICSEYCSNMCDKTTGNCSCLDSYFGPRCTAAASTADKGVSRRQYWTIIVAMAAFSLMICGSLLLCGKKEATHQAQNPAHL